MINTYSNGFMVLARLNHAIAPRPPSRFTT